MWSISSFLGEGASKCHLRLPTSSFVHSKSSLSSIQWNSQSVKGLGLVLTWVLTSIGFSLNSLEAEEDVVVCLFVEAKRPE